MGTKYFCHCGRKASSNDFLCKLHRANNGSKLDVTDGAADKTPRVNKKRGVKLQAAATARQHKKTKFKKHATKSVKIEDETSNLGRFFDGLRRADKLTAHFVQGGGAESNRKKH
jgi:hypothetical protein